MVKGWINVQRLLLTPTVWINTVNDTQLFIYIAPCVIPIVTTATIYIPYMCDIQYIWPYNLSNI